MRTPREYITTTSGLRGHFAVHIIDGEPWQTGIGSYPDQEGAEREARDWAACEGLPCVIDGKVQWTNPQ